jgi:hypothetical protein
MKDMLKDYDAAEVKQMILTKDNHSLIQGANRGEGVVFFFIPGEGFGASPLCDPANALASIPIRHEFVTFFAAMLGDHIMMVLRASCGVHGAVATQIMGQLKDSVVSQMTAKDKGQGVTVQFFVLKPKKAPFVGCRVTSR